MASTKSKAEGGYEALTGKGSEEAEPNDENRNQASYFAIVSCAGALFQACFIATQYIKPHAFDNDASSVVYALLRACV